jgi:hypothetical protein
MSKKDLAKTGKCLGMGIYTTIASRELHEAWWSLDKGQVESGFRHAQRAAAELRRMENVDGRLAKHASVIERKVRQLLKSFKEQPGVHRPVKSPGKFQVETSAPMKVDDKVKVKKGLVDAIVQVQNLKTAIAKECRLPVGLGKAVQ